MTCKITKKCDHDSLVFCSCCNRVKCKDCDAIWNRQFYQQAYPWTLTTTAGVPKYPDYFYGSTTSNNSFYPPPTLTNCKIGS